MKSFNVKWHIFELSVYFDENKQRKFTMLISTEWSSKLAGLYLQKIFLIMVARLNLLWGWTFTTFICEYNYTPGCFFTLYTITKFHFKSSSHSTVVKVHGNFHFASTVPMKFKEMKKWVGAMEQPKLNKTRIFPKS